jgi:hypothetical protein
MQLCSTMIDVWIKILQARVWQDECYLFIYLFIYWSLVLACTVTVCANNQPRKSVMFDIFFSSLFIYLFIDRWCVLACTVTCLCQWHNQPTKSVMFDIYFFSSLFIYALICSLVLANVYCNLSVPINKSANEKVWCLIFFFRRSSTSFI